MAASTRRVVDLQSRVEDVRLEARQRRQVVRLQRGRVHGEARHAQDGRREREGLGWRAAALACDLDLVVVAGAGDSPRSGGCLRLKKTVRGSVA